MKSTNVFKIFSGVFLLLLIGTVSEAQVKKKVNGKVTDTAGAPIVNAAVVVDGVSVSSASDGTFQINVSKGGKIEVSANKFKNNSIVYNGETKLNVILRSAIDSTNDVDSFPVPKISPSMRYDAGVRMTFPDSLRRALAYEDLRSDDVVFRIRLWEEIDCRQKINLPFVYRAKNDLGEQQNFMAVLLKAVTDPNINVATFSSAFDDQFQLKLSKEDFANQVLGPKVKIEKQDSITGQVISTSFKHNEIVLDSFFKYHIKEEVIFDRESSRLFWRIIGIAPVQDREVVAGTGIKIPVELFWVYFPDLRPILATYKVYNGKNFTSQKSWDDFFQERLFSGYIYKTSQSNFFDRRLQDIPGMKGEVNLLRLYESDNIKNKIFDMEQNAWSY